MLQSFLERLAAGQDLSMDEMSGAVDRIMQGRCTDEEIARLLTTLRAKGETVAELAGAAAALRRHMQPIRSRHPNLVDTCGTGGDASGTFNISTAAALVTAAAGIPVAKHGNRRVTSKSGSADVLAALGVNVAADVPTVERCLEELGIGFCFAPSLHPAMKHVAEVRRKLGVPTIFNLLGPLANPASAPFQVVGVSAIRLGPLLAEALALLGTRRSVVVCGSDGLDEVTLAGPTHVSCVDGRQVNQFRWQPEDFEVPQADKQSLQAADPAASAGIIRDVLGGRAGPPRDITVANAAAALWVANGSASTALCARRAAEAIDSGAAADLLRRLAELSHS